MSTLLRRIFARTSEEWAADIRESIRRDNMREIFADPHYVRDEHVYGFERDQRRRHMLREQATA